MDAEPYISVRDLTVEFGGRPGRTLVLDKLSLELQKGRLHSVLGPNGCGKTTLLLCLGGLLTPQAGSVSIGGLPPQKAKCGFVFQNYRESLFPWLTVLDNIAFGLRVQGASPSEARRRARQAIDSAGVSLPTGSYPYELSGGQQQLTAVLRAVVLEPDVLLLDEPFASLDVHARDEVQQAIEAIWRQTGTTTLLVSHDLTDAMILADRLLVFSARPARVVDDVSIESPRPRERLDPHSPELARLRERFGITRAQASVQ